MKAETYLKKDKKSLYKIAQRYFNKYIRLRDPYCICCGKPTEEAGHFQHGGNNKYSFWLDFDERNLNGECTRCNHFLSGNLNIYAEKLIGMYGADIIAELNALKWKSDYWDKEDLIKIIEKYKGKTKKISSKTSNTTIRLSYE